MDFGKHSSLRGLFLTALLAGLTCSQQPLLAQDRFIRQPAKNTQVVPKPPLVSILDRSASGVVSADQDKVESQEAMRSEPHSVVESKAMPSGGRNTNLTDRGLELHAPAPEPAPPKSTSASLTSTVQETLPLIGGQFPSPAQVPVLQFSWKPRGVSPANPPSTASPFAFVSDRKSSDFSVTREVPPIARPASVITQTESTASAAQPMPVTAIPPTAIPPTAIPPTATPSTATPSTAQADVQVNYREIASGISQELVEQFEAQKAHGLQTLSNLEAPPGWQAVGEKLSGHINRCDELISRKAYLSATEEAQTAIHHLLRVLDLYSNQYQCEPLWAEAQQALREAEDFSKSQRLATDTQLLGRLIASHETQILKNADISQLSPLAAVQHYHRYAQERLVAASQGHPWASELFYTLGRSLQALSETDAPGSEAIRWRALTYYRSARDILPTNAAATNQLGYLLLQMDRASEARDVLLESVQNGGSVAAWQNLVEASRRLGEVSIQDWATRNYLAAVQQVGQQPAAGVQLVEVDPQQFASLSPYRSGPQPVSGGANSMPASAQAMQQNFNGYVAHPMWNSPTLR